MSKNYSKIYLMNYNMSQHKGVGFVVKAILSGVCAAALVSPVFAATVPKAATRSFLTATQKHLSQYESAQMTALITVWNSKNQDLVPPLTVSDTVASSDIVQLWKTVGTASKLADSKMDDESTYRWKNAVTLASLNNALKVVWTAVATDPSFEQYMPFVKPALTKISGIGVQTDLSTSDSVPRRLVFYWTGVQNKTRFSVHVNVALHGYSEKPNPVAVVYPKPTSKNGSTNGQAKTATTTSPSSPQAGTTTPVNAPQAPSASAPGGAVNIFGQGGVQSQAVADITTPAGRDAQRMNDLHAIAQALQLFNNDTGRYPMGVNLVLGSPGLDCLNSDGFTSSDNCPYPYMSHVPADPGGLVSYSYTAFVSPDGMVTSYSVGAQLEGIAQGTAGTLRSLITLRPTGIFNR